VKKIIPVLLALLFGACATEEKKALLRSEDLVGVYEAEHSIDTVERLSLKADGRFVYEYLAIFGPGSGYEGRWELRGQSVVLLARDKDGKEAEFPLEVLRRSPDLALVYSQESYATAKATMLLPDSYRRTSKTPNQHLRATEQAKSGGNESGGER
jgi:hypothetical protein